MDALKKFFEKKKTDVKFGKAGQGKKLTEASSSSSSRKPAPAPQARVNPSNSAQKAGQAALERFSSKPSTEVNWSQHAIKAQARRELEAEKKLQALSVAGKQEAAAAVPPQPVQPVLFTSPLSDGEPDTYEAMKAHIQEGLFEQLGEAESRMVAACLIIHTCNKPKEKVEICVDTLCKYMSNIISHPTEDKYRRIRAGNPAFRERIAAVVGGVQLLRAVGFEELQLQQQEDSPAETFFVFTEADDVEGLSAAIECLEAAEPVRPVLYRSAAVLLPQQSTRQPQLPPEFFTLTKEELLKEMQIRKEVVEESLVLRTKAMRDRANAREMRKYRFSFIRVRFPDGLTLQGTFRTADKFSEVTEFVRAHLANDWRPFQLCLSGAKKMDEEDADRTLAELFLAPAALLNFKWDESVADPQLDDSILLKPEVLEQLTEEPDLN